jgi:uncharacterized membrane protein YdjX (TVP38/TMEM64 family)
MLSRFMQRRILLPLALFLFAVAVLVALHFAGLTRLFTVENIEKLEDLIRACGAWGPLVYIVVTILGVAILSPAMPWVILASVFGVAFGTLYASIAITMGCGVAFLLARHAFRPIVCRMAGHTREFQRIDEGVRRHGWRMVLITRLVPVFPFNIQNYAYGLTGISFWTYIFTTWICTLPAITAYVFASSAVIGGKGDVKRTALYLGVGAIIIVLLSFVPTLLKKSAPAKQLDEEESPAAPETSNR